MYDVKSEHWTNVTKQRIKLMPPPTLFHCPRHPSTNSHSLRLSTFAEPIFDLKLKDMAFVWKLKTGDKLNKKIIVSFDHFKHFCKLVCW